MQKLDFHVQVFRNPCKGTCSIYSTLWILFAYWRNKRAQLSSLSAVSQKVCTMQKRWTFGSSTSLLQQPKLLTKGKYWGFPSYTARNFFGGKWKNIQKTYFSERCLFFRKWDSFFKSPNLQKEYSKKLSWAWNLKFPPITVNNLFKFQAQNSFLE